MAFARSREYPPESAAAGTSPCRAVEPAESASVPTMASTTTCQISSASSARRIGSGATASPLRRSAAALVRTGPIASTLRPAIRPPTAAAPAPAKTAIPVRTALPVVVSTSHGIATVMMTFPLSDTALATTRRVSGVKSRDGDSVNGPRSPAGATEVAPEPLAMLLIPPLIHSVSGQVQHLFRGHLHQRRVKGSCDMPHRRLTHHGCECGLAEVT